MRRSLITRNTALVTSTQILDDDFATGGFPLAYGDRSQEEAIWEVLAWATDHPAIKGAVIYEAGDYGQSRGLRAPNGRFRPATAFVTRAIQQLRESAR